MQKTKIPYCDYTINPVRGLCPMDCKDNQGKPYCYARRMYKRFHWNPEIRFDNRVFSQLEHAKQGRVFIGSTMDLFGDWVSDDMRRYIFRQTQNLWWHTFIFLTKKPENLIKWSPFPDNCLLGVSVTKTDQYYKACYWLKEVKATVKFISFEPLLERILPNKAWPWGLNPEGIYNWLIVGCQTPVSPKTLCKFEWVEEIIQAGRTASIPIFVKPPLSNIMGLDLREMPLSDLMNLHRKEMPSLPVVRNLSE